MWFNKLIKGSTRNILYLTQKLFSFLFHILYITHTSLDVCKNDFLNEIKTK